MCPLQIIYYIEPLSLTLHGINALYPPPVKCQKLLGSAITQKSILENTFLHCCADLWLKVQNTHHYRNLLINLTFGKSAVNGPANGPVVIYSRIQNWLSRAH